MSLLLGENPIRRRLERLGGSPQARRATLTKRVKYGVVDGVRVTYVASGEVDLEDWRRLVKEGKDEEFIRKVVDELRKMDFTLRWL